MSGKQAKRYRALEGRVELLEGWMNGALERAQTDYMRAARHARSRERETRRWEYIWRTVAIAAVVTALIVSVLAAGAVRGVGPQEPEPAAVVCRWIGCDPECAVK